MTRRDFRGQSGGNRTPIEEVLARIDAPPIPDADELAGMSVSEIERQLTDLGIDMDAELGALLAQAESPPMSSLATLSSSDVERMSIDQVERQLEAEGVDVRAWLSRAETLIRNARARAAMDEPRASLATPRSRGLRGGAHQPALPRSSGRRRRRLPQALAASIVMVAIAGVTLSILDEPKLDSGAPFLAVEGPTPAPSKSEGVVLPEEARKREDTQLARAPEKLRAKQRAKESDKQSASTRDLRTFGQSAEESRGDAVHDKLVAVVETPLMSAAEPRPAPAMIPPKASPSPSAAPTAAKAIVAATGVVRQQRLQAGMAKEAEDALTTVHALGAGRTLAMSLAGLPLREADRKALLRVFSEVDVSSGANLRLFIENGMLQTADLQLPQGPAKSAVRNSRGELVLER